MEEELELIENIVGERRFFLYRGLLHRRTGPAHLHGGLMSITCMESR